MVSAIDQKISTADVESESLKKAFFKGNGSTKDFLDQLLQKRITYHKYQILKVKVNQQ